MSYAEHSLAHQTAKTLPAHEVASKTITNHQTSGNLHATQIRTESAESKDNRLGTLKKTS